MQTKTCNKCNKEIAIENFCIRKDRINQKSGICKECKSNLYATPIKPIPDLENEEWRDIEEYKGFYVVSNKNRVKRIMQRKHATQKIINHSVTNSGYHLVCLTVNGINKNYFVHRLVAMAFIPNPENKPHVNHLNGKEDNTPESLEWCTPLENIQHAWRTGLSTPKKGESHNQSKLTEKEVLEIRAIKGMTKRDIGKLYNIGEAAVGKIIHRQRWAHI